MCRCTICLQPPRDLSRLQKADAEKNKALAITREAFLLQILLLAQHVSDTTMPTIRSSRILYRWLLPVVFSALVFKLSVWCGAEGCVSGLRAAALNQELESIIQVVAACGVWCFGFQVVGMV